MKRFTRLSVVCLLGLIAAMPTFAKDKVQNIKFDFHGKQRNYLLLIPGSAAPNTPLPAVMLLHAQGGYNSDVMGLWHSFASIQGFIAIAPESTSNNMWDSRLDGPDFLHAVVLDVSKKHPIDPTKLFLFGDDSGGIYGYEIALFDSPNWASACAEHAILDTRNYSLFKM